jgi:hypothetical protein
MVYTGYFINQDCYIHGPNGATNWYFGNDRCFYLCEGDTKEVGYFVNGNEYLYGWIMSEIKGWTSYKLEFGYIYGPNEALPWLE